MIFACLLKDKHFLKTLIFLWAEAKKGKEADIYESFSQLILTIAKHKHHQKHQPPPFLGAFDAQKIAFIKYSEIMSFLDITDFDYQHITPSKHESKEFQKFHSQIKGILESKRLLFDFDKDNAELKNFIKTNFVLENAELNQIQITEDNFVHIYIKWLNAVKPSIAIDYEAVKPDILDTDFYLADLLSYNNSTKEIRDNLRILLEGDSYRVRLEKVKLNAQVIDTFTNFSFNDKQEAHKQFWNKYKRPPKEEFWDKFIARRDLLVPTDIRERKGAFFTPQIWVKKAQSYLASALGENYQDEYYIWDCAAGTGNLLANSKDKYRIFASDFDKSNVDIMKELAKTKESEIKLNLLENHIFTFDFLNDDFSSLPQTLQEILKDEKKREKLIIFINPPYAEATSANTPSGTGQSKDGVANSNKTYTKYLNLLGRGANELFAQFFIRIQQEIPNCILASFSTLKYVNSQNFAKFRQEFKAEFLKGFICPADTFDNVKGEFPIGFLIWNLNSKKELKQIQLDIFERNGEFCGKKGFYVNKKNKVILNWLQNYYDQQGDKEPNSRLAYLVRGASDFQSNNIIFISQQPSRAVIEHSQTNDITAKNLIPNCIFYAVRKAIKATWLNDRDQFLYPNDKWQKDSEFQNDCLAFTLFHGQNRISSINRGGGVTNFENHFIPFTENEVNAKETFKSDFMTKFISSKFGNCTCHIDEFCHTDLSCHTELSQESEVSIKSKCGYFTNAQYDKKNKARNDGSLPFDEKEISSPTQKIFIPTKPLKFSKEAKAVFDAGREIWRYYHTQNFNNPKKPYNSNASLYDIKEHFQGRKKDEKGNETGRMNARSDDEHYNGLMANLRLALKELAAKITPKIYEYGFLKK